MTRLCKQCQQRPVHCGEIFCSKQCLEHWQEDKKACKTGQALYEIWSEGYMATGEEGRALFHGYSRGHNFEEACDRHAKRNETFALYYDGTTSPPTYWGCRLYSNRADAQDEGPVS